MFIARTALRAIASTSALPQATLTAAIHSSSLAFSGHSRWAKIHRDKAVQDGKKGNLYSNVARDIAIAVRNGGSADPEINASLAVALKKARVMGVPKENIANALNKASGGGGGDAHQGFTYEALGPGQTPLIIECISDNPNRTFKHVRDILSSNGARFAPVAFMFARKGRIRLVPKEGSSWEDVWETAVDGGAEDVSEAEPYSGEIEVITPPPLLNAISQLLSKHEHSLLSSELVYIASDTGAELEGDVSEKLDKLIDALEEDSDCVRVWTR